MTSLIPAQWNESITNRQYRCILYIKYAFQMAFQSVYKLSTL